MWHVVAEHGGHGAAQHTRARSCYSIVRRMSTRVFGTEQKNESNQQSAMDHHKKSENREASHPSDTFDFALCIDNIAAVHLMD